MYYVESISNIIIRFLFKEKKVKKLRINFLLEKNIIVSIK